MDPRSRRPRGSRTPPRRPAARPGSLVASARELQGEGQLVVATRHLAVELPPQRLAQCQPDRRRLRNARGDEIVARHLEPRAAQVAQVAEYGLARCSPGEGDGERLDRLAVQQVVYA